MDQSHNSLKSQDRAFFAPALAPADSPNEHKRARALAWGTWILCILLLLSANILWFSHDLAGNALNGIATVCISIAFAAFGTVGALVVFQRPRNAIGWIFCLLGISAGTTDFSGAYSTYMLHGHGLPGALFFSWLGDAIWPLNWGLFFVFLPLLFPNGQFITRRWRFIGWAAALMILLASLTAQMVYIGGKGNADFWNNVSGSMNLFMIPLALAAFVSLVLRFIRARARERQQIKWLAYGVALALAMTILGILINDQTNFSFSLAILLLPLSLGISILRSQLYDIDRLISRTLIYLLLTGLLILTYLILVFGLQFFLQGLSPQNTSPVAIVISTLGVAALFQPLRRAIQRVIDRAFYRHKYVAEQVLHNFSTRLHDELDLTQLTERLLSVVQETMQPEHISLWFRSNGEQEPHDMP